MAPKDPFMKTAKKRVSNRRLVFVVPMRFWVWVDE
jgi:hypothetical protein